MSNWGLCLLTGVILSAHTITLGIVESHLQDTSTPDEFASAGLASTPVIHWVGVTALTAA